VPDEEMLRVFNLGVGMLVVVAEGDWLKALSHLRSGGLEAWEVGDVVARPGVEIRT
jgi:phosphoribosylformylglycinamidine cyclo-ligase